VKVQGNKSGSEKQIFKTQTKVLLFETEYLKKPNFAYFIVLENYIINFIDTILTLNISFLLPHAF